MRKKKTILIIGGTGFIGFHLAKRLIKKNFIILSISTKLPNPTRKVKGVKYLLCDICKLAELKKVINKKKKYNYVINLGGYVDHTKKKKTYNSHYLGCKNLATIFLGKKIERFIQIGSSIEYGKEKSPQIENRPIKEKSIKSTYGLAKFKATKYLINLYKKNRFPAVILRLYLIYGPHQDTNRFLPIIITNCVKKKSFPCSEGVQYRDFLYIDDLIDVIEKFLNKKTFLNGQIFNIGSGKPRNIKKTIKLITKKIKGGLPIYGKVKLRKDEIIRLYPSIKKIKKYTSWRPKVSFKKGLIKSIMYYEKNCK